MGQGQHHLLAKARSPRSASCWATSPSSRSRSKARTASTSAACGVPVERPGLGLGQDVLARPGRELADALARLDEPGERPEQGHLIGGVGPVSVGHAPRAHHLVAPLPGPEPRGGQAGELGYFVDLVGPIGSGELAGQRTDRSTRVRLRSYRYRATGCRSHTRGARRPRSPVSVLHDSADAVIFVTPPLSPRAAAAKGVPL